jgi:uncharacterized protein
MRPNQDRGVAVYLVFTFALSSVFYFLIARSGHVGGGWGAYIGCLMWCPGAAALLSCKVLDRDVATLGWKWGKSRYEIACYLIPLGYATLIYVFVWLTGLGGFYNRQFYESFSSDFGLGALKPWANIALFFVFTATIGVIRGSATVLGEEIGWRGFLVPELAKRHGFAATAVISGFIWALWHYPIFLLADGYNGGTPVWYYLPLFTLLLPVISFVWTWMRLKSGSIWPGVVLHAAHNTFIQQFYDPLTVDKSKTRYVAGEFGAALGVISVLLAIYFWSRRHEVAAPSEAAAAAGMT